ncbi:MAG: hypothetical protein J4G05_06030 [Chlorobi bacterium]|nr:hypothetical protein [Chlorobiota bacterium]
MKVRCQSLIFTLLVFLSVTSSADTLHVGVGQEYSTLSSAARNAQPGETILVHCEVYNGGEFI